MVCVCETSSPGVEADEKVRGPLIEPVRIVIVEGPGSDHGLADLLGCETCIEKPHLAVATGFAQVRIDSHEL
jgi:hypothetical protein